MKIIKKKNRKIFQSNSIITETSLSSDDLSVGHDNALVELNSSCEDVPQDIATTSDKGRPKRGRKRKFPEQTRSDRKKLLNNNKPHINTRGNFVEGKTFDESFICMCSKDCTTAVPLRLRKRLFSQFWTIGSFEGRVAYLINCVSQKPKKRSYSKTNMKNRMMTRKYKMFGIEVCQKALTKTLQISPGRITVALKKISCESFADCRGKAIGGWNALPLSTIVEIRNHIASFPKYVSHYTRNQTESKFLHSTLNLAIMYRLYTGNHKNHSVSKSSYKKVFYKDFNLKFKVPKKDTCKKCDHYAVKIMGAVGVDRQVIEEWHNNHLEQAEALQKQMKDDLALAKNDVEIETLTFDMQKTLSLPRLSTNIVYYKRQLNVYNFGIHVGSSGKGIFNVWMETEGSKGTQEVGSCLKKYIMSIEEPVKKLILWSDSCGGQNRSIKIVLMLINILQNHASLQTISIRYLQSGHSFMQNDTEFGDFECALKMHDSVCTVEKYIEIMKNCRIKNQFCVNRISREEFFSVKQLEDRTTNRKKDLNNMKVSWLDTHEIIIEKSEPTMIKLKKNTNGDFQTVNIEKKNFDKSLLKNVKLNELWPQGRTLSKLKVQDLKEMLFLVPEEDIHFYEFLENVPMGDFVDDVEGFGERIDFDAESEEE